MRVVSSVAKLHENNTLFVFFLAKKKKKKPAVKFEA